MNHMINTALQEPEYYDNWYNQEESKLPDLKTFYRLEDAFLLDLEYLDKDSAREKLYQLIEYMNEKREDEPICVQNYLIVLSGLVTRRLAFHHLSSEEAFAFNVVCDTIVMNKITNDNEFAVADELLEFYMYALRGRHAPTFAHDTVNEVIRYIDEHLLSFLSVEGIAEEFNVSTSHLSRIFKEHTGVTLVEYINIRKVEEAQYYLRFSTEKISDISNRFHFCNQSYFTRIFKKYTGQTPRRFRNSLERDFFHYKIQPNVQLG